MTTWEYYTRNVNSYPVMTEGRAGLGLLLNDLGSQGWELVNVFQHQGFSTVVLKRKVK